MPWLGDSDGHILVDYDVLDHRAVIALHVGAEGELMRARWDAPVKNIMGGRDRIGAHQLPITESIDFKILVIANGDGERGRLGGR